MFVLEAETLNEATAAPRGRSDLKFGKYIHLKKMNRHTEFH